MIMGQACFPPSFLLLLLPLFHAKAATPRTYLRARRSHTPFTYGGCHRILPSRAQSSLETFRESAQHRSVIRRFSRDGDQIRRPLTSITILSRFDTRMAVNTMPSQRKSSKDLRHRLWREQRRHPKLKAHSSQILTVREKESGARVVLIGTMHFNPGSIRTVDKIVRALVRANNLSSLVIELCPGRYKAMEEVQPKGSPMRSMLDNEMQAAVEAAQEEGFDSFVLGDSSDAELLNRLQTVIQMTFRDILDPINGWKAISDDFVRLQKSMGGVKRDESLAFSDTVEGLSVPKYGPLSESEAAVLLGAPVALFRAQPTQPFSPLLIHTPRVRIRLPIAWARARSLFVIFFLGATIVVTVLLVIVIIIITTTTIATIIALLVTALVARRRFAERQDSVAGGDKLDAFRSPVRPSGVGRVAAVVLLLERDEILAGSIREACAQAKAAAAGGAGGGESSTDTDKTVVAVLGLAHCKGVAKRLTEG
eukprot:jgi/Bigna1/82692/fgenesh1_pg.96_\